MGRVCPGNLNEIVMCVEFSESIRLSNRKRAFSESIQLNIAQEDIGGQIMR